MLYGLTVVDDHPCFKMQELFNNLFFDYVIGLGFNDDIFPNNFTGQYIKGHGKSFKDSLEEIRKRLPKQVNKKKELYSQFVNNNSIKLLCQDSACMPEDIFNWKSVSGKLLNEYMLDSYKSKLDLVPFRRPKCKEKPTHRFYADFIDINGSICPFCGLNSYKNKFGRRREDLDHYLYKGKYPLAAVNMWNLIPTCAECNQDYKKAKDVLFDGFNRVEAYYPYDKINGVNINISLKTDVINKPPEAWNISILPKSINDKGKVKNWMRVYGIITRYQNELAYNYDAWMQDALIERNDHFKSITDFKEYMLIRASKEKERFEQKLQPKAFLKQAFYIFVAYRADYAFIGRYIFFFNAKLNAS